MAEKSTIGMFMIGLAVGLYFPGLPAPLQGLNAYLGLVFIILAIILFLKS